MTTATMALSTESPAGGGLPRLSLGDLGCAFGPVLVVDRPDPHIPPG
jgi:hypothetical protein